MSKAARFVVWPERTGNPLVDNRNRNANTDLSRRTRRAFLLKGSKNRKRKKFVYRAERINYLRLFVAVMEQTAAEHGGTR